MMIVCKTWKHHIRQRGTDASPGLALHNTAKAAEIAFLIERAYIITWPINPRHRTFEYIATSVCIFVPYVAVTAVAIA